MLFNDIYTAYQYVFYKCFKFLWTINRNWLGLREESYIRSVAHSTLLFITFIFNANIVSFVVIIGVFKGYDLLHLFAHSPFLSLVIALILLLINYLILFPKKQYKKIINKFENESRRSRVIGNILVASYVLILGFPGCFILGYIGSIVRPPSQAVIEQSIQQSIRRDFEQHVEWVQAPAKRCLLESHSQDDDVCKAAIEMERDWCLQHQKVGDQFYAKLNCHDDQQMLKTAADGF